MPVYLVDRDLPGISSEDLEMLHRAASTACRQSRAAGRPIQYLHSMFIPGEQRCLCLFEGDDEVLVAAVNEAAGLPFTRIVAASRFAPDEETNNTAGRQS
jgi:hypothetical protein